VQPLAPVVAQLLVRRRVVLDPTLTRAEVERCCPLESGAMAACRIAGKSSRPFGSSASPRITGERSIPEPCVEASPPASMSRLPIKTACPNCPLLHRLRSPGRATPVWRVRASSLLRLVPSRWILSSAR